MQAELYIQISKHDGRLAHPQPSAQRYKTVNGLAVGRKQRRHGIITELNWSGGLYDLKLE